MLVGLLAVDPRRLYLYWELPESHGLTLNLVSGSRCVRSRQHLDRSGGLYLTDLEPEHAYRAEFLRNQTVVASSNEAVLPPESAAEPENPRWTRPPMSNAARNEPASNQQESASTDSEGRTEIDGPLSSSVFCP